MEDDQTGEVDKPGASQLVRPNVGEQDKPCRRLRLDTLPAEVGELAHCEATHELERLLVSEHPLAEKQAVKLASTGNPTVAVGFPETGPRVRFWVHEHL